MVSELLDVDCAYHSRKIAFALLAKTAFELTHVSVALAMKPHGVWLTCDNLVACALCERGKGMEILLASG